MMKKHLLALFSMLFLLSTNVMAQIPQAVEDDFEGNGTINTWLGDDCGIDINFANPFSQGMNTSATVLEYDDNGGDYANIRFDVPENFDLSTNNTFSFKIYVPSSGLTGNQSNQVSLKLQDGTLGAPWSTQSEIIKSITLNQWQIVSFDFENDTYINLDGASLPPIQRTDFNRVLIQVNGENNTNEVVAYIDDFTYDGTISVIPSPVFNNLVWSDEFDTNGALDATKWFHQTQLPAGGSWYNGEIQHYTNRTDNSVVNNGIMKLTAKKEVFNNQGHTKQYTSARLNSKFAFKYGRIEIRAKLPTGVGTWPAIWMLGKNITETGAYWQTQGFGTTGWPACGEIDIMEHWGTNQNYVQSAMHTPSSFGGTVNHGGQMISTASTDFHLYALEWSANKMVFSVDGIVHYTYDPDVKDANTWPFDAEQYLLLNIAIEPGIASSFVQSTMEIDYVRIYQETPSSTENLVETKTPKYFPNPVDNELTIVLEESIQDAVLLKIYSIDGKLVKTYQHTSGSNTIKINGLEDLNQAYYFVSFRANGQNYSLKFLKQ
jgi:beta-glucanase (GH16 family)